MKYKLNEDGSVVVRDGKIVMVGDDDKEFAWDAVAGYSELKDTRGEAGEWRKKLRAAESKLEAFGEIEDPAAALEAMRTVATMGDDHKAQVEELKKTMETGYTKKITDRDQEIEKLKGQIFKHQVTDRFSTSETAKKLVYTPKDAALIFGQNFKIEEGQIIGQLNGKMIHSKEKPGEPAGFDEALEAMIEARPDRDSILRSSGMQGSGARPDRFGKLPPRDERDSKRGVDMIRDGLTNRK